ncbi:MAG: methyltransferase, CheR-type [Planctomycetaceae bacterium]|nr:methyltransferase, CheR-type [Planctomycetaceae bacterium]
MTLTADQFEFLRHLLDQQIGMSLEADQQLFVTHRLLPVARRHGWNDLDSLLAQLRDPRDNRLVQEVSEALVTHETSFFRDAHYYDELSDHVLPRLIARRTPERRLTIWCAACSTGQEAYSVAMLLRERFAEQLRGWNIELLATDLSSRALEQARAGQYSDVEVRRGISDCRLTQHFHREPNGWRIDDHVKQMVRFQQANLIGGWPQLPLQDLVLLRNVLIYMSPSTRQSIITRIQKLLHPEGCLMLGSTETSNLPDRNKVCIQGNSPISHRSTAH